MPRELADHEWSMILARYADWLRDRLHGDEAIEERCVGALLGTIHQYVGWPTVHHPLGARCPICDVERELPR